MESTARKLEMRAVFQEFGEIAAVEGGGLTVRTALAEVRARRATSCLVAPEPGDRVLLATEERGDAFVLAVLARPASATTTLAVEGDLAIKATTGKISIAAQQGIDIVSAAPVRIASSALEVNAVETRLVTQALSVISGAVQAELEKVKVLATSIDSVIERWSQRVKRSYRTVEGLDQVKARHIDYAASGNAHLRGENTLVTAHDLVKVNAEQVHIG